MYFNISVINVLLTGKHFSQDSRFLKHPECLVLQAHVAELPLMGEQKHLQPSPD